MALVDLVFDSGLDTSHPVDLVFGQGATSPPGGDQSAVLGATISKPLAAFQGVYTSVPQYRGPRGEARGGWQVAKRTGGWAHLRHSIATRQAADSPLPWGQGTLIRPDRALAWDASTSLQADAALTWRLGTLTGGSASEHWQRGRPRSAAASLVWERGVPRGGEGVTAWQVGTERNASAIARHNVATPHAGRWYVVRFLVVAVRRHVDWVIPWGEAMWPRPGRSPWTPYVPPEELCYDPPLPGDAVDLIFKAELDSSQPADLVFICDNHPSATIVVPVRRLYMITNDVYLLRVDNALNLPCTSLSVSMDADSFVPGFTANVDPAFWDDLLPAAISAPIELESHINGTTFRWLAEQVSREREFGQQVIRVQGRGIAALLDEPYEFPSTFANSSGPATVKQIAADVLSENGVPLAWTVDCRFDDWLVPLNVFTHRGSRMSALQRIAQSVGGYVRPAFDTTDLVILQRYPLVVWSLDQLVPDYELPSSVASSESIRWEESPIYNRVHISGTQGGILGQITRSGTAGDVVASMITDDLMTDITGARQRGLVVLSDCGRKAFVTRRIPVLSTTGVIPLGSLVRYTDAPASPRIGLVRSNQVQAEVRENATEVWQSITVEIAEII